VCYSLFSGTKHTKGQSNKNLKSPKTVPAISLYPPSVSSAKTTPKLPTFASKTDQSTSSTNQIFHPTLPFNQLGTGEPHQTKDLPVHEKGLTLTNIPTDNFELTWDLEEINTFTREIFKQSIVIILYLGQ
jgi:hypothetical protein